MAKVVPFRALRPQKAFAGEIAAPPYDVLSVAEAREQSGSHPYSFLHVEKSEIDILDAAGVEDRRIYERAKANLEAMIGKGMLVQDEIAGFYLYRQQMGSHIQTGIAACVSLDDYNGGLIRRHELTRADKERERTLHIDTVGAQTGPLLLAYRGEELIDLLTERIAERTPEYDFTTDSGVRHTVWTIQDPKEIRAVTEGFLKVGTLYIADGHHRAEAAAAVARLRSLRNTGGPGSGTCHFMLAVLFSSDQLRIMDYNRAVRDLNGLSEEAFLNLVGEKFVISDDCFRNPPERRHDFGMYMGGKWRLLTARSGILRDDDPISGLDVSILQQNLLGPILGILDPRIDPRIDFIGGIRGMAELEAVVDRAGFAVAFSLHPPTVAQMMAVADAGEVMPPKSTWFEPKLLSGLFIHLLE